MRYAAILVLLCAACGDSGEPVAPVEEPVRYLPVSGTVYDSVLGQAIAGLRVLVGDSAVITNSFGQFSTTHRSGAFFIAVSDIRFDPLSHPDRFEGRDIVNLYLRGRAPYITTCEFVNDSVIGTMVDLQGRKSINRRTGSFLTAQLPGQVFRNDAHSWSWRPIDNLTWRTASPLDPAADTVAWRLEDAEGNSRTTPCVRPPPQPPCETCGGGEP